MTNKEKLAKYANILIWGALGLFGSTPVTDAGLTEPVTLAAAGVAGIVGYFVTKFLPKIKLPTTL